MKMSTGRYGRGFLLLLCFMSAVVAQEHYTCRNRGACFLKRFTCPKQCPQAKPTDPKAKGCYIDCKKCEAICRHRKPNCNTPGSACFDPRFIGGDGIVFYFHGKRNEHFSLVSDSNLQINARFIGLRPTGRPRDFTWIQALGIMFGTHTFTVEATRTAKWNDQADHLQFSYEGEALIIPQSHLSQWNSSDDSITVERTAKRNSITITLAGVAEISVNVIPVTEEDDRIHNYQIPADDCFAHLEVQFRFLSLSPKVDGVLGRTYRPDYKNPAKPGVAMPVVGGENQHRTSSLISSNCEYCIFSPTEGEKIESSMVMDYGTLDCTNALGNGMGIVCRK